MGRSGLRPIRVFRIHRICPPALSRSDGFFCYSAIQIAYKSQLFPCKSFWNLKNTLRQTIPLVVRFSGLWLQPHFQPQHTTSSISYIEISLLLTELSRLGNFQDTVSTGINSQEEGCHPHQQEKPSKKMIKTVPAVSSIPTVL